MSESEQLTEITDEEYEEATRRAEHDDQEPGQNHLTGYDLYVDEP